jgi:SH3-like domain-containing protein
MRAMRSLAALLAALLPVAAAALDYRSVAETAVLYDAPSHKASPLFVIAAGTPVEAVVTLNTWVKVRDMQGDLAWIELRLLADRRMLQVRPGGAQVRTAAADGAALAFEAAPDVLLEPVEAGQSVPVGWLKVRHAGGQEGYVKPAQVWGM